MPIITSGISDRDAFFAAPAGGAAAGGGAVEVEAGAAGAGAPPAAPATADGAEAHTWKHRTMASEGHIQESAHELIM